MGLGDILEMEQAVATAAQTSGDLLFWEPMLDMEQPGFFTGHHRELRARPALLEANPAPEHHPAQRRSPSPPATTRHSRRAEPRLPARPQAEAGDCPSLRDPDPPQWSPGERTLLPLGGLPGPIARPRPWLGPCTHTLQLFIAG